MTAVDGQEEYLASVKELHTRRLRLLTQQAARQGASTPPEITMEIEDIQAKLDELDRRLAGKPVLPKLRPSTPVRQASIQIMVISIILLTGFAIWLLYYVFGMRSDINEKEAQISASGLTQTVQQTEIVKQKTEIALGYLTQTAQASDLQSRDNLLQIYTTKLYSVTTSIENGVLIADINSPGALRTADLNTRDMVDDFDYTVNFSKIETGTFFVMYFRVGSGRYSSFVIDNRMTPTRSAVTVKSPNDEGDHVRGDIKDIPYMINQIKISCKNTTCNIYINNTETPFFSIDGMPSEPGFFRIGFGDKGKIGIDRIAIQEH